MTATSPKSSQRTIDTRHKQFGGAARRQPDGNGNALQTPASSDGRSQAVMSGGRSLPLPCSVSGGRDPARAWPVAGLLLSGMAALALLLAGVAGWGYGARISSAVMANGHVEAAGGGHVVQHPEGGVVSALHVGEGDHVAAGTVLLRLDDTRVGAELAVVTAQRAELGARRARLQAEYDGAGHVAFPPELAEQAGGSGVAALQVAEQLAGQAALFAERLDIHARHLAHLDRLARQYGQQVAATDMQIRAVAMQKGLIDEELAAQESLLERGLSQAARVLALRREAARLDGLAGALAAERASAEAARIEAVEQGEAYASGRREQLQIELRDLALREIELAERQAELEQRMAHLELPAPRSGVIQELGVPHVGAVVRPAEVLMRIIPSDLPPVVLLRADPRDIHALRVGQEVTLLFPALRRHGDFEARGEVLLISADTFTDARSGMPYYRVEVAPLAGPEDTEGLPLLPGMEVEAYIHIGEHRPADYLLQPVTDNLRRAMRDF